MKKILIAAVALLSMVSLQSCIDGDNQNHGTNIITNSNLGLHELYADQTLDSLHVISYDSWTARVEGGDWLEVSDKLCKVPAGYIVTQTVLTKTTPNTTGKMRTASFVVQSEYSEYGPLSVNVFQFPWLNITAPQPQYEQVEDKATGEKYVVAKYEAPLNASDTYAVLGCCVYSDATLTSDANWLLVQNEDQELKPGAHGIKFVVNPNSTESEREAHVTLTSNGVSNVITYKQKGKK